jgi:glycosyltransferase involved in cell wall biosynthesis
MKEQQIFFLAPASYDSLFQRHQAFANLLASSGYRVIYVNPVSSPGFSVKFHFESTRLNLLDLKLPFRAANLPWFQRLIVQICQKILKRKFKFDCAQILWIADPSMAFLADHEWSRIVYDRCDRHGFFSGQRKTAWQLYERLLFQKADLLIASHRTLLEDIPEEWSAKTLLVGNACSEKIGCRDFIERFPRKERPVKAVSAGAHFDGVDCRWLKMLAQNDLLELHIAGVGRGKEFEDLVRMPSVHFHGQLAQKELFELYHRCDVGLIPFRELELTRAVDPIKAYEYAAAGLQVWSTPVAGISEHELVDFRLRVAADVETAVSSLSLPRSKRLVPRWPERLQTVLDRMVQLPSD